MWLPGLIMQLVLCRSRQCSQHATFEAARCALTAVHFPDRRTLTADESPPEPLPAHVQTLADALDAHLHKQGLSYSPKHSQPVTSPHNPPTAADGTEGLAVDVTSVHPLASDLSAAHPATELRGPCQNIPSEVEPNSQKEAVQISSNAAGGVAMQAQADDSAGLVLEASQSCVKYHAAGYDPAWLLLFAVQVNSILYIVSSIALHHLSCCKQVSMP